MYKSMELVRNFLMPAHEELPADGDQYYLNLMKQYQVRCGDNLGFLRRENGDVYFENSEAETRFARSLEAFFHGRSIRTDIGVVMQPSLLYLYYGRFLGNGLNCPVGSPVKQRMELAAKYNYLKNMLQKDLDREVDFSWDDIWREENGENMELHDLEETASGRQELIRHAIDLIKEIEKALLSRFIENSHLPVFQILADMIEEEKNRILGLKLINLLAFSDGGSLMPPPRFKELVEGAMAYPPNIFYSLVEIWEKSGGEQLFLEMYQKLPREEDAAPDPLLERLIYVSAEGPLNEARVRVIRKILEVMSDPEERARSEQAIELLERTKNLDLIRSDTELTESLAALSRNPENSGLFYEFYFRLPGSKNENVDPLIRRLLKVATAGPTGVVRSHFISKILQDSKNPDRRGSVEKLLKLLEDPEEVKYMNAASSKEEYIEGYKERKKNGGGSGSGANNSSSGGGSMLGRIPLKRPCNYMLPASASVPQVMQAGSVPWMMTSAISMPFSSAAFMVL